jgi:arylsulfatase A-like enzyme
MVRDNNWKYIKSLDNMPYTTKFCITKSEKELYELNADPKELRNVRDNYPKITAQLDQLLIAWQKDTRRIARPKAKPEVSEETKEKLRALGYTH